MKIKKVEMLHADAGWRPWSFIKLTTDDDIIGWSECTDSNGSPSSMSGCVFDLEPLLLDKDPNKVLSIIEMLRSRTRQSPSGTIHKVIAGIENALWDIKAKSMGIPVYELFGGPVRQEIECYWSHCGTSRVRASDLIEKPRIKEYADLDQLAKEVLESGFKAVKTNIALLGNNPHIYMPGFDKSPGGPELNLSKKLLGDIRNWISYFRSALGEEINILLDLNFNFKTEGYKTICKALEDYDLSWIEIDSYDPLALLEIKNSVSQSIASCENLYGLREFRPFFNSRSMDIAIIDVIWNGMSASRSIAELANSHEMNVCTHNYNGHLSSAISSHFCAITPNLRMAEIDIDDVPWRDDLFTHPTKIKEGRIILSDEPGWGTEPIEKAIKKFSWPK